MRLSFRTAEDNELEFCEFVNRQNMSGYLAARGIPWDSDRFRASWMEFENLMILAESEAVGLLRLAPEKAALGLRDLQVSLSHQGRGIGSWAILQTLIIAADRGFRRVQLRVYEENPAKALYSRLGFRTEAIVDGTAHMAWVLPPNQSFNPTPSARLNSSS